MEDEQQVSRLAGTTPADLEEYTRRAEAKKDEFERYLSNSKLTETVVEVRRAPPRGFLARVCVSPGGRCAYTDPQDWLFERRTQALPGHV
jgi:hypothetical protein